MQVEMVVPEVGSLPGMQTELEVSGSFRQMVFPGEGWPPGTQAELVVLEGCRPLG